MEPVQFWIGFKFCIYSATTSRTYILNYLFDYIVSSFSNGLEKFTWISTDVLGPWNAMEGFPILQNDEKVADVYFI